MKRAASISHPLAMLSRSRGEDAAEMACMLKANASSRLCSLAARCAAAVRSEMDLAEGEGGGAPPACCHFSAAAPRTVSARWGSVVTEASELSRLDCNIGLRSEW